ncbi:MAG: preprotein translocase subunit YajC [Anaerolineales bacterium]
MGDTVLWIVLLGLGVLFLFLPQWLARRRQSQKVMTFESGDHVITVGGFVGTLTYINPDENVARLLLTEGVEVEIVPGALARKLVVEVEPER